MYKVRPEVIDPSWITDQGKGKKYMNTSPNRNNSFTEVCVPVQGLNPVFTYQPPTVSITKSEKEKDKRPKKKGKGSA